MEKLPSFNYQRIYFFLLSFYGIIFILSLTDVITIENVISVRNASFINICIGLIAWLLDLYALHLLGNVYSPRDSDYKTYRMHKLGIFSIAIFSTSLVMLFGLAIK